MVPYLDFVNNDTIEVPPEDYTGENFHSIPYGAKFSVKRGLKLILDVESFDYAYFPRGSKGIKVALSDARDKAVVNQEGYYVSTGKFEIFFQNIGNSNWAIKLPKTRIFALKMVPLATLWPNSYLCFDWLQDNLKRFFSNLGSETLAALIPTLTNATENAVTRFLPSGRKCYQDHEFHFKNLKWSDGFRYSNKNCLYEAIIENILKNCTCIPSFAQGRKSGSTDVCHGTGLTCALDWIRLMGNDDDPDLTLAPNHLGRQLKCHQRCEYQYEVVSASSSSWPSSMFYYRTDYCFAMQKLIRICSNPSRKRAFLEAYKQSITCEDIFNVQNTTGLCLANDYPIYEIVTSEKALKVSEFIYGYTNENFAVLKIFINYPFYTSYKKDEEMTILSFIANAGGLLGLCLGMSFVSITEVLYFVFNSFISKVTKIAC